MLFKIGTKTIFPIFKKNSVNVNITLSPAIPQNWDEAASYTWGEMSEFTWGSFSSD